MNTAIRQHRVLHAMYVHHTLVLQKSREDALLLLVVDESCRVTADRLLHALKRPLGSDRLAGLELSVRPEGQRNPCASLLHGSRATSMPFLGGELMGQGRTVQLAL